MWRKRWVVLTLTGDVTVLKIIKPIMTATKHDDTHATDPRPCSPFSTAQNENIFVLLCTSMCKSKCQIHHITGQWEITADEIQHTHSECALVGACKSSRGHMERWIRLISDRQAGQGIEAYVNTDSVFSLVLTLQRTFMIRRDRCQCEHAKQCPIEHLMLFYICCVVSISRIQIILMES